MESERPGTAPAPSGQAESGPQRPKSDDDLTGVIADVERQLETLRTYRAQHEEARVRWQAVEKELGQRRAELDRRAAEMATEQERLNERHAKLRELDEEMLKRTERTERDFESLAQEQHKAAEAAQRREADLSGRAALLEQREQRLVEHAANISRHREQVQALESDIAQREKALADRAADLERQSQQLAGAEKLAGEARQKLESDLAAVRAELARAGEAQSELMKSLTDREKALNEARSRVAQAAAETDKRTAALAEAEQRVADFKRQIIERDSRIQDLSGKLAAATAKLREVSTSIQQQAELLGQARAMEAELSASNERVAELEARLASAGSGEAASPADADSAAERDLLRGRIDELEEQLAEAESRPASAHPRTPQFQGGAQIPPDIGEAIHTRWRRLRTMRTLLRDQADKLRQAGEAVRSRMQQVERLDSDRQTLARQRADFAEVRQRAEAKPAPRPRALAAAIACVICAGALAGISWAIGGQLAPAVYAAKAVIAVDSKGSTPAPDQLAEWQKYHESLLKDPALTEVAAERLNRRGIVSLGTPGALLSRINTDLSTESPANGQLTFELRGKGAAETTRVLDTYVTALVSQANADRERRADGLGTVIATAATSGEGPIDDQRLIYSSVIFVLGGALSFAAGAAAWRQIARSKARFEREQMDELAPAEWERPPQTFSKV